MRGWMKIRNKGIAALGITAAGWAAFAFPFAALAADQDIVVLYTNDVHCGVEDNIGYGGLALYKEQMEAQTPYVTLVDAGDAIQGAPMGTLSEGEYIIQIMNQAGYDVAVPGNHEFDYGVPRFLELADELDCGYYSCNFVDLRTGETVFEPYRVMEYGDTQMAYVGVTTPESFSKSSPAYFQDDAGNYIYGFCEDESGQALYRQVQESVDAARGEGADYVILVGHLGNASITPVWSSEAVLANTTGIDACIDGHSHETVESRIVRNKEGKEVVLTQTGTKLANIGKLTIGGDGTITAELISQVAGDGAAEAAYTVQPGDSLWRIAAAMLGDGSRWQEIYSLNRDRISDPGRIYPGTELSLADGAQGEKPEEPAMAALIEGIKAQYAQSMEAVIGRSEVDLTVNDPATGQRAVRRAETNMGDLTADAYRVVLGADIGFSNGGGIRSSFAPGSITYNNAMEVFPFGNMACAAEVTGQQIKDALEMGLRNYPEENGGFLQVSGLTFSVRTDIPSSVTLDDKGNFTGVAGEYRVTDIQVGGEPLDLNKTYTLASHNYMLKEGGDGMTMFAGCRIIRDEVMTDADMLAAYIRDSLGGVIGSVYGNPAGDGRIRFQ